MSLAVMMVFEILPALALGFVVGRFWQVRRDELDRRIFKGVVFGAFKAPLSGR